jgi:hypothetical protein
VRRKGCRRIRGRSMLGKPYGENRNTGASGREARGEILSSAEDARVCVALIPCCRDSLKMPIYRTIRC